MKYWNFLKAGDIVDVVAPGSGTRAEELSDALKFLESWDLKGRVHEPLFSGHPYVSHGIEKRVKDLKKALSAKDSKAVWCLRGGYGAIQLVPEILKLKQSSSISRGKLLLGYSDVSTLHVWLSQKWNWTSCHGPLLDGMGKGKYPEKDVRELYNILFGSQTGLVFDGLEPKNKAAAKVRTIEAPLVAGNLMVLASTLGTPLQIRTRGKILCLEESGERGYRVDRLFWQLQQSKALDGCLAVLLGDFLGGDEAGGKGSFVVQAISEFCLRQKIPVFSGLQIGHGDVNRPLFLGPKAVLTLNRKTGDGSLHVRSGGRV
jgi:muramoyltetrapeptide carboxypeptidase